MFLPNFNSKLQFQASVWFFLEAVLILSYAVKPSPYRRLYFVLIASIAVPSLIFTKMELRNVGMPAWGMGCRLVTILFFASTNILLCDIQRELRLVGQSDKENDGNISQKPFLSRLWWAIIVWGNPRGINFAHEPTAYLPPRPKRSTRLAFLSSQLLSILYFLVLYDIMGIINRANPYHTLSLPIITNCYQKLWRLAGFVHGALIYAIMELHCKFLSIPSVLVGITSPHDWPDVYGSVSHAYTLRGFWGKTWHQTYRRTFLMHTGYLSKALGIPKNSGVAHLFTVYVAFFMSGLLHYAGDAVFMQSLRKPGAFHFFMLQAVGITIEGVVLKLAAKCPIQFGLKPSRNCSKILGYLWVLLWINLTLPLWVGPLYRNGFMVDIPHFSFILGLWKGNWVPLKSNY